MNMGMQALKSAKAKAKNLFNRSNSAHLAVFMLCALSADAALAAGANPIEAMLNGIIDFLNSGVMRSIAILGVFSMGVAAYFGKLSWEWALRICAGIILTFGGAALVDQFSGYVA